MLKNTIIIIASFLVVGCNPNLKRSKSNPASDSERWKIKTQQEWQAAKGKSSGLDIKDGLVHPQKDAAYFSSTLKKFKRMRKLESITLKQTPQWNNWQAIPKVTPPEASDAPVFIPVSKGNYWFLSRYSGDAANGYHAWHSKDMKSWKHYGPVSSSVNKWVTSAEYADGKFYIYYDKPNDEDPHLIIDEDLTDGKQGKEIGKVLKDPTHGSDMAVFRNDDGIFHIIYEDWSPINPRENSWDSPLAGHADSPDGINGFEPHEYPPPIDKRTTPTGIIKPYKPARNQLVHGPDPTPYTYEVHEGPQDAFGDYTAIKVGGQYYIFCDYDPHDESKGMRVGRWRSDDIAKEFVWDGEIGEGFHPDPTVGFAEGKFYLIVQRNSNDFISDGPWVDGIEIRVGVDTNNDGNIDDWTDFTKVKETYSQKPGFVRVVEAFPATLDVSGLKAGYGFKVDMKFHNKNKVFPILDSFEASFVGDLK
ncbi:hypothetical protein L0P88_13370 [Muricauda sp. SCSIO 64092]|uniref:hypothetical protein n=1 Tax=Allomuricauda sp. SCSIO 64092 TaxID=2908842 RepID=UPI001FF1A14B|nr:hypothetical protein [Muricauda sp. SCSIO 64092]UOY04941.1 hypothetical protein L0P88_13370 [Muricauda sp. SCSIO 64092]